MTNYNFSTYVGQALAFNSVLDVLVFDDWIEASSLRITPNGSDTIIDLSGQIVRLVGTSYSSIGGGNFNFLNGSLALFGVGSAFADMLTGTVRGDYADISHGGGGADTVNLNDGSDVIFAGATLTQADRINGGLGNDRLILSGIHSQGVALTSQTLVSVETIELQVGTTISLALAGNTVASTEAGRLTIDATALGSQDSFSLNASAVLSGSVVALGGAGVDTLTGSTGGDVLRGGDAADTITGGGGDDVIEGGLGGDVMNGGAGLDRFIINLALPRSDSSPVSANLIDRIVGFEGAGAVGGDLVACEERLAFMRPGCGAWVAAA